MLNCEGTFQQLDFKDINPLKANKLRIFFLSNADGLLQPQNAFLYDA